MSLVFVRADLEKHREALTRFNMEYLLWADASVRDHFGLTLPILLGMPIPDYVDGALEKLCEGCPPDGVFYVVFVGDIARGMGVLRRVREGVGEIKRIYVSPVSRGGRFFIDALRSPPGAIWIAPYCTSPLKTPDAPIVTRPRETTSP